MIKPVTYQGVYNFNSNLYALEIKSRFIDQNNANGYYTNYGAELEAKVVGNQIQIGTGAFVVQGRMNEIVSTETVTVQITDNTVGYVVARIETYHPADENNCTLKKYIGSSLNNIPLQQDDVYAAEAENENRVYELPIYSFEIKNGTIINLTRLIRPVDDYSQVQLQIDELRKTTNDALEKATSAKAEALEIANAASAKSDNAISVASNAKNIASESETKAANAVAVSNNAVATADNAKSIAENTVDVVNQQHEQMREEINTLAEQIAEKQGTTVVKNGESLTVFIADNLIETTDEISINGGNA